MAERSAPSRSEALQELYRNASSDVRPRRAAEDEARASYEDLIEFVTRSVPPRGRLLEVGCGDGWGCYFLHQAGFEVMGTDLHDHGFVPPEAPGLTYQRASALDLPYADGAFDVVVAYQMLEHLPDPQRGLREMVRVLKPGGRLCVVGPNLLSPLASFRALTRYVWANRPMHTVFIRRPGLPRHPFGNTFPEAVTALVANLGRVAKKLASPEPSFTPREPDLNPPFVADNDATYLCNPIDLIKFLPRAGCDVVQVGAYDRPRGSWLIASGTYVAAQKRG